MSVSGAGRLSAVRLNRIVDNIVDRYIERRDRLVEDMLVDGYPAFNEPLDDREQYERLLRWRDTGDPMYWQSPEAQRRLEQLSTRFGGAAPVAPGAMNSLLELRVP